MSLPGFPPVLRLARLMAVLTRLAAIVAVALCVAAPAASDEDVSQTFNAKGFQPYRELMSELPFEHIDPMTGNVMLTFTDLMLPGNGGFDLKVQRTFNSKIYATLNSLGAYTLIEDSWAGLGWTLHFGRVANPGFTNPGPVVEMPDGSRHPSFLHVDGVATHFMTRDFWTLEKLVSGDILLRLPNGVRYTFGHPAVLSGTLSSTSYLYATNIADPFGNTVDINYYTLDDQGNPAPGDAIQSVVQHLATGETRTITFTISSTLPNPSDGQQEAAGSLRTMSLSGASWTWNYTQTLIPFFAYTLLKSVQPPEGQPWSFQYAEQAGQGSYLELTKVTTPNGGSISYQFANQDFPLGSTIVYAPALAARTTAGIQNAGTWSYQYTHDANLASGNGPNSFQWLLTRGEPST